MKSKLTYSLLMCLLFFRGYSNPLSAEQENTGSNSYAQHIQYRKSADLIGQPYMAFFVNDALASEEEDDDSESSGKKGSLYISCSASDTVLAQSFLSKFCKNNQGFSKHFCHSSGKYIFLRTLKV